MYSVNPRFSTVRAAKHDLSSANERARCVAWRCEAAFSISAFLVKPDMEKPVYEVILRAFDLGMLEIRSDMQTALAAGDTSRPQCIRVLEYN